MQTKIQFSHLLGCAAVSSHLLANLTELCQLLRSDPTRCQRDHLHFQYTPDFVKADLEIDLVRELHVGLQGARHHIKVSMPDRDPTASCGLEHTARFQSFDCLTNHSSANTKGFRELTLRRQTVSRFPCPRGNEFQYFLNHPFIESLFTLQGLNRGRFRH